MKRAILAAVALLASGSVALAPHAVAATPPGPTVTFGHTVVTGEGFDICEAPSTATMRAWLRSPFRSVNIYFAGTQRLCQPKNAPKFPQRYLSKEWVRTVTANGWSLIPTFVGLQAPCANTSKAKMSYTASTAEKQGRNAANQAVDSLPTGLVALGLPKGTPAYDDIEPFDSGHPACDRSVRRFLQGWIEQLRSRGYRAGVYGLPTAAIRVLVAAHNANPAYPVPDAIWFARYNGIDDVASADIPSNYLANHRIHQYLADINRTYAGITLNIDKDAMRGDVERASSITSPSNAYAISGEPRNPDGSASTSGVNIRQAPNTSATVVAHLHDGSLISIDCQAVGQTVNGDYVWDKVLATSTPVNPGGYVSDLYTNTTGGDGISKAIPHCDTTRPTASLTPFGVATLSGSFTFSYTGSDPGSGDAWSGVASYDVRWRRAAYNGGYGAWQQPAAWQHTPTKQQTLSLAPGYTYCVEVRARDRATNVGAWSAPGCIARALDDRALTAGPSWSRATGSQFYFKTITATKLYRARLTLANAQATRVGVVATLCPSCGIVRILVGSTSVGTLHLTASTTMRKRILLLPAFSSRRTGTIVVRVISAGKPVQVDGLVVLH